MADDYPRPRITIDPAVSFGRPQINGITCEAIAGMVVAGESLAVVAADYDLTLHQVILACWHEGTTRGRYRRQWRAWSDRVAGPLGGWSPLDVAAIEPPPAFGPGVSTPPA